MYIDVHLHTNLHKVIPTCITYQHLHVHKYTSTYMYIHVHVCRDTRQVLICTHKYNLTTVLHIICTYMGIHISCYDSAQARQGYPPHIPTL